MVCSSEPGFSAADAREGLELGRLGAKGMVRPHRVTGKGWGGRGQLDRGHRQVLLEESGRKGWVPGKDLPLRGAQGVPPLLVMWVD